MIMGMGTPIIYSKIERMVISVKMSDEFHVVPLPAADGGGVAGAKGSDQKSNEYPQ